MLPVNRRAILENQLLGAGVMLDDIGRIVTDNYNTPEGIMAGYNAAKITNETFDNRRQRVAKTLKEKYGMSDEEIEAAIAGEYEGDVPINPATGLPTDLINRLNLFNQAQRKILDARRATDIIAARKERDRNERIDRDRGVDVATAAAIQRKQSSGLGSIGSGGGGGGPQNISTSGGSIGDRVSSSYRDDPDTGLL